MTGAVSGSPPPTGIAPVLVPTGGFAIDGDVFANTPEGGAGDWVLRTNQPPGTGGAVLNLAGAPLNPGTTFHFNDPYDGNDNVFVGGCKWRDNPNTWAATTNKASSKTDINNVLLHLTTDADGHTWVIVAADRLSTSGDSYIDFEFLQNSLVLKTNGTFSSEGPDGGRTVGDVLLSLAFTGGGKIADFFAWRWQSNGTAFTYADVTGLLPAGRAFVALNSNNIAVPYGAFGETNYVPNAFAEAAVDLTALLGDFDSCLSLGFKAIMVKTKTSASDTSSISDFINPIAYTLNIGPAADAGPDQAKCFEGDSTAFVLHGQAASGLESIASNYWSVVTGAATVDSPDSLITTARVASGSATLRLTVVQQNGCTKTDDVTLGVAQPPACSISGPASACLRASSQFSAPPGMTAYAWSVTGNGEVSGPTNQQVVTVVSGGICGQGYTVSLVMRSNVCTVACATDVEVADSSVPQLACPADVLLECPADTRTNATGVATAVDTCSRVTVTYSDSVTNGCGNSRTIFRLWTATDECGNATNCVQTITVRDRTPPVIVCPTNRVLECPADTSTNATGVATATDTCGTATITYADTLTNGCGSSYTILRRWTATDECSNSASCVQTITVRDRTPPVIVCPTNQLLECPADTGTNATGIATATDSCGNVTITYADTVTNGCGSSYTIFRRWTATDGCSNSASCVQTITVRDTTPPAIVCPTNQVLECPADTSTNATGVATAADTCGTVTIRYSDTVTNGCGSSYTIFRRWTATDQCSNTSSCVQTIIVQDLTPPVIVCPTNRVLECPADTRTNATGVATATDTCGKVTITFADTLTNGCGSSYTIFRRWTATDQCGNTSSCVQTIAVQDTTPPVIVCPTNRVLECPADTRTNATGVATATDTCSRVTVTYADALTNGCGSSYTIFRRWTATDECNNSASCLQTITVRDTTPPVIVCPTNRVLECPADTSTNATGVATASDTCGNVIIRYSDTVTNGCGSSYTVSRRWTASDDCGNSASCVQTIAVRDLTPPVLVCPTNRVLECPADTRTNNTGVATASDNCGTVTIAYADTLTNGCGSSYTIFRRWTATDQCGNSSSCVQTITVQDTTPPLIVCPTNRVLECPADTRTNATGVATASDTCGTVTIAFADTVTNGCGSSYTIFRRWTATDQCSNTSSCVQTITVQDLTPPVIVCPTNRVLECPADTRTNATGVATATDTCGKITITFADTVTNGCGSSYTILRRWTATDDCGNSSSCLQTITVRDTTPPVIVCPTNRVLECPADTQTNATGVATATDTCSRVTVTYTDTVTNGCGSSYTIFRRWTATDECNNSASCVQTMTVRDLTPPVIVCPTNRVLECPADTRTNNTGVATASDTCGTVTITYADTLTNGCGSSYTIFRRWTATDQCGNSSSCVQTIAVQDTTPPLMVCPTNRVLECPADTRTNATGVATASDTCGTVTIAYADTVTNGCGSSYTIFRRWTAADQCGNNSSCIQTIAVQDTTPPLITCPTNRVLECPADTRTNNTGVASASDTCGTVTITYADALTNNCGNSHTIFRRWTATDQCGNTSSCVQTITVRDTIAPTITAPSNTVVECGSSLAPSATGSPLVQDACSTPTVSYSDSISNSCGSTRLISRLWTAVDACGNSNSAVQLITVRDTTPPALTLPANRVLDCPGDTRTNVTGVATAVDACGSVTLSYSDVVSNSCGNTRTVWRTWTAIDQCGHSTNGVQTIVVRDITAPRITCPNVSVQCAEDLPAAYTNFAAFLAAGGTATDTCDAALDFALISDSGLVGRCPGRVTRVYRVTDDCGNFADGTQTITVDDTIAPVLACPTNVTVECGLSLDPVNTGRATASDNCSTNVNITYSDSALGSQYNLKFYAADSDTDSGPYAPTYLKLAPGSLPCPGEASLTGRAVDPLRNAVAYGPTAGQLDALMTMNGGSMALGQIVPFEVVIDTSGAPGPERGTIEFTASWSTYTTSNDRFGYDTNYMVYCAFVDIADPGSIDPNYNARVESFSSVLVNAGTIDEQIQGTFRVSGLDSGDRVVVEIWVVLDSAPPRSGGTVAAELVSAQKATVPPEPISVGVQTTGIGNLNKLNPLPPPQSQPPPPPLPLQPPVPPGVTISLIDRTWAATDDCGNRSTCVQRITVRDTTPPVLAVPADRVLEYPADLSPINTGVATAVDACGSAFVSYSDVVSNSCAGTKTLWRTWTAIDQAGNSTNAVQTIILGDGTPPTLGCPPSLTLAYGADTSTNATGVATASDGSGIALLSFADTVTNNCGNAQTILRRWTAVDACGNSSSCVQTIVLRDTTPPVLTCPSNLSLECGADISTNSTGVATASDGSGINSLIFSDTVTNNSGGAMTILRRWTAADPCGNSSSCVQIITVQDSTAPTLSSLTNRTIAAGTPLAFDIPTAYDLCSTATVSVVSTATNATTGCDYCVTRTWEAVDAFGNRSANQSQTITVATTPAPQLSLTLLSRNQLLLRWPASATDYRLECADTINAVRWHPVAIAPLITNGECWVFVEPVAARQFFRLANTPPMLESAKTIGGKLLLTWPSAPAGFQLEASNTLLPGSWVPVALTPGASNALNYVEVSLDIPRRFYRLKK